MLTRSTAVIGCFLLTSVTALAVDGVVGTVMRPGLVDAKVKGCQVSEPKSYSVTVGDVIELDYSYPVFPAAIPKKVDYNQTTLGVVTKSSLGFREVTNPGLVGSRTIAFYFDARKPGTETVNLLIDNEVYKYEFKVSK